MGLSIATLLSQNHEVMAVDIIPEKVEKINKRISPIQDEYIEKYLKEKELNLTATLDAEAAYKDADFVVIAAPTNYDSKKNFFDTSAVEAVIKLVIEYNPDAIMVIKSTIPVGYTASIREKFHCDNIIFSPEFLRESKALYDNLYPSRLHEELLRRDLIHADEVPCQVLHEDGRKATQKSYMWIYQSGSDGKHPVALYEYQPGRASVYPIEFLKGFHGMIQCDGYAAYGCIEDENLLPAEKGVAFCNRLFFKERLYKELSPEDRKAKRLEEETPIWDEFWSWIDTLDPSGGSKLEKAVKYALNHKESLMNYLLDGRCEISNNSAERKAKVYATGRKNFLFHDSVDGAKATAIVMSLVETAKANNLNAYKYLYTLLLYMPDYKNEPAGIEQLLPWSTFVQDKCSGIIDDSLKLPENRGNLPI